MDVRMDAAHSDGISCGVSAVGAVRVPWGEIQALRKSPGQHLGQNLASAIKLSDEQTVAGLAAVLRAIETAGWRDRSFADWGVVASGRSFGRVRCAAAFERYKKLGARGTSPLITPHLSLHAMAGAISIGLGSHGPNFGVSGNDDHLGEILLTGLGMMRRHPIEGLWLVACDVDPEPTSDASGGPTNAVHVQAAAIALQVDACDLQISLSPGCDDIARLSDLVDWILTPGSVPWRGAIAGAGALTLRRAIASSPPAPSSRAA